jgi:hypothetical protein
MIDPDKLKVGDVIYSVKERNHAFHRKKIHREIDGEEWFKYDRPLRTYELVTYTVLGILRKELEGIWKHDPDGAYESTEYYVRYQDDTHVGNHVTYFYDNDKYFVDKTEALNYIELLETQAKELDKDG